MSRNRLQFNNRSPSTESQRIDQVQATMTSSSRVCERLELAMNRMWRVPRGDRLIVSEWMPYHYQIKQVRPDNDQSQDVDKVGYAKSVDEERCGLEAPTPTTNFA